MREPVHTVPNLTCPRTPVPGGAQRLGDCSASTTSAFLSPPQPRPWGPCSRDPHSLPSLGSRGYHHYDPPCGTWGWGKGLWVPRPPGLPLSGEDSAPLLCPGLACAEPESGAAPGRDSLPELRRDVPAGPESHARLGAKLGSGLGEQAEAAEATGPARPGVPSVLVRSGLPVHHDQKGWL